MQNGGDISGIKWRGRGRINGELIVVIVEIVFSRREREAFVVLWRGPQNYRDYESTSRGFLHLSSWSLYAGPFEARLVRCSQSVDVARDDTMKLFHQELTMEVVHRLNLRLVSWWLEKERFICDWKTCQHLSQLQQCVVLCFAQHIPTPVPTP